MAIKRAGTFIQPAIATPLRVVPRGKRVTPTQACKSTEIVVGRADFRTMFNRDCSQMGIRREIATGPGVGQKIEEQLKMTGAWRHNRSRRLPEPQCGRASPRQPHRSAD
jgi:hypothetical protein